MKLRTKIWTILACAIGGPLLLAAGLVAWSWAKDPAPRLLGVTIDAPKEIHIGSPVAAAVAVECPWYRWPAAEPGVKLPEGLQLLRVDKPQLKGLGWLTWRWACVARLQPVAIGTLEGGTATLSFTHGRNPKEEALNALIPPVEVKPRLKEDDDKPEMAGEVSGGLTALQRWLWWGVGALVVVALLAGLAFWLISRGSKKNTLWPPRLVPPWEKARIALQELTAALPLAPEPFFVRFTDIVRCYCEERFLIRATESTTQEFLEDVRKNQTLPPEQRQALAAVLSLADEIKFAKGDATQEQLQAALTGANKFVTETVPPPPTEKSKTG